MTISTLRHQSIFEPSHYQHIPISIIGCGAIGSRVFLSLIELGLTNIRCFDFDKVEAHNIANQAFNHNDIGKSKVSGLARLYETKAGTSLLPATMQFIDTKLPDANAPQPEGIVFLAVDSFAARREILETCLIDQPKVLYVIDTRIASTHGVVLHFDPTLQGQTSDYLRTLGNDDLAEVSPCGTTITVGATAAIFANLAVWTMICKLIDPLAIPPRIDLYLKPTMIHTGGLA